MCKVDTFERTNARVKKMSNSVLPCLSQGYGAEERVNLRSLASLLPRSVKSRSCGSLHSVSEGLDMRCKVINTDKMSKSLDQIAPFGVCHFCQESTQARKLVSQWEL